MIFKVRKDYKSKDVNIDLYSELTPEDGESLMGKTIAGVEASANCLTLTFDDGYELELIGHTFEDFPLDVSLTPPSED